MVPYSFGQLFVGTHAAKIGLERIDGIDRAVMHAKHGAYVEECLE